MAPTLAVGLPQTLPDDDPAALARYARRAEELGFAALWTLESGVGSRTTHMPLLDGVHVLTYAAAVTSRARLGIAVVLLPRRTPALLAKELATVDRLSGGRLTVGVGLGNDDESVAALGFPGDRRVT